MEQLALIIIDMQEDYIGKMSKYNYYIDTLIDKINERIAVAKKQNETVIYVKNIGRRNKEPYVSDFAEGLSVVSNFIVEKGKSSIFDSPILLDML